MKMQILFAFLFTLLLASCGQTSTQKETTGPSHFNAVRFQVSSPCQLVCNGTWMVYAGHKCNVGTCQWAHAGMATAIEGQSCSKAGFTSSYPKYNTANEMVECVH